VSGEHFVFACEFAWRANGKDFVVAWVMGVEQ
jgi:hypothetical protein